MRRMVMTGLIGIGMTYGLVHVAGAQEMPSADEIREMVEVQVGDGVTVSGGGSVVIDSLMTSLTIGAIGADGGVAVAEGDVPGGSDGTGALAVNS